MERMYNLVSVSFRTVLMAAALQACGPDQNEMDQKSEEPASRAEQEREAGFLEPNPPEKDVKCAITEFVNLVHHGTPSAHSKINVTSIRFTVESYQQAKASLSGCTETTGMVIHYGFDPVADTLSLAFSFACMDIDADGMGPINTPDSPLYVIDANRKLGPVTTTLKDWRDSVGKAFRDNIVVDKYDHDKFQYIYKETNGYMAYKLQQVDDLIAHNNLSKTDWVEVVAIAEPLFWPKPNRGADFSMRTCLVAYDSNGRMLADTNPPLGTPYQNRASDLGSPCPVACGDYAIFQDKGIDVRKPCKEATQ